VLFMAWTTGQDAAAAGGRAELPGGVLMWGLSSAPQQQAAGTVCASDYWSKSSGCWGSCSRGRAEQPGGVMWGYWPTAACGAERWACALN
jgi:hypothetical protein